jgi:hypothetical protein
MSVLSLTDEEANGLGIMQDMLIEAVEKIGALNMSGHYPISEEIRYKLA